VEKPLASDQQELEQLADQIDKTGTEVAVAFHRRYDPAHQQLRQHVQDGDVGTMRLLRAADHDHLPLPPDYIPYSGGIWLDMLVHDFDFLSWTAGVPVVGVFATGSVLDEPLYAEYHDVDTGAAVLTLASGATAVVTGSRRNGAGQDVRLEVCGSKNSYAAGLDQAVPLTSTEPGVAAPSRSYDSSSTSSRPPSVPRPRT
jgi:myo-inositol 2-dehydrogenase/D-chiro-inositol 1-dehydrogenase